MATKTKDTRKRNFACLVYPPGVDSQTPDNWLDKVKDLKIPSFVSPCHENEPNDNGVGVKKSHWHVMLMFEGKKSDEQVRELCDTFCGVGLEKIQSIRAYARYLCHLDEGDDKAHYSPEDVISLGGADYYTIIDLPEEKYIHIGEIMEFCIENCITSFSELSMYAVVHRKDWFRILVDKNTTFLREFLKSRHYDTVNNSLMRIDDKGNLLPYPVDRRTGEAVE